MASLFLEPHGKDSSIPCCDDKSSVHVCLVCLSLFSWIPASMSEKPVCNGKFDQQQQQQPLEDSDSPQELTHPFKTVPLFSLASNFKREFIKQLIERQERLRADSEAQKRINEMCHVSGCDRPAVLVRRIGGGCEALCRRHRNNNEDDSD